LNIIRQIIFLLKGNTKINRNKKNQFIPLVKFDPSFNKKKLIEKK
jgi:hypothetical protein